MRKTLLILIIAVSPFLGKAQTTAETVDTSWKNIFRGSHPRVNDVVHTKLDVRFDYDKSFLYGKEWLTLKPTFDPTDSATLDAKGMEIKELALMNGAKKIPLKYQYDGNQLTIRLDRVYKRTEKYTLYFDYISKPNELKVSGSAAITDAKGLYFIKAQGGNKNKTPQIWTQGETESNSAWMITIDKPNQKSTQEITMTVPEKYVTLSNGLLKSQKKNTDGTRSDYWVMDLPHAPYLFFMGVGDFSIVKDSYKGKEVSYYVEKDYQPYARKIFGNTPEMMSFFSSKLGVDFPWQKYAQMVGRDYVSGAMENTTATLHQESVYQNARELLDGNRWEETIAHELFHQWFGDLVTAESWSNITVNESFANYSEYLWDEYKHGKDFADAHHIEDMQGYLMSQSEEKDLVRYRYKNREDVFDGVSYNKGGCILHMLRNYVGDEAFYASLNHYLTTNKFKTGEAAQLRLSFEAITGKDFNWFWNQWYYGSGHPKLNIRYNYDQPGYSAVIIEQKQSSKKVFRLPVAVDVYTDGKKKRYSIETKSLNDTFYFPTPQKPEWINVDADKILLAETEDNKTEDNYKAQWKYGKNYAERIEAIEYFAKNDLPELAEGLNDPFYQIKIATIENIENSALRNNPSVLEKIEKIARMETNKKARAAAINFLVKTGDTRYAAVYELGINDSSYSVAGQSLKGLADLYPDNAYNLAKKYSSDAKGILGNQVMKLLIKKGDESDFEFISQKYDDAPLSQEKIGMSEDYGDYLLKLNDIAKVKSGVDHILGFRSSIPKQYLDFIDPGFRKIFGKLGKAKGKEVEDYISQQFK